MKRITVLLLIISLNVCLFPDRHTNLTDHSLEASEEVFNPPGVPVLSLPANNAVSQPLDLQLKWLAVTGATKFRVQVSTDQTFTILRNDDSTITTLTYQVSGLEINTYYFWRVQAKDNSGWGNYSEVRNFRTIGLIPGVPQPVFPPDNSGFNPLNLTFSWNSASNADYYHLQVSADSSFSSFIVNNSGILTPYYSFNGLPANRLLYWRVRSGNSAGLSNFSARKSFFTMSQAAVNNISFPLTISDNADFSGILYFGLNPAGTDGLDIELGEEELPPLPPSGVFDCRFNLSGTVSSRRDIRPGNENTVGERIYNLQFQISSGTEIRINYNLPWNVTGRLQDIVTGSVINILLNDSGTVTIPNAITYNRLKLTVNYKLGMPKPPQLYSPPDSAINLQLSPLFRWSKSSKADKYGIEIAIDSGFTQKIVDDSSRIDTFYQSPALNYLTKYYWRVYGKNGIIKGDYSNVRFFTTIIQIPETPILVSPGNNANGLIKPVEVKWQKSPRAVTYRLTILTQTQLLIDTLVVDTNYIFSSPPDYITCFWRVKALNAGGESNWSETRSFKTLGVPYPVNLIAPINLSINVPVQNVIMKWSRGTERFETISRYYIQIATDSIFINLVKTDSTLTDTIYNAGTLNFLSRYFWRVRSKNQTGWGDWSAKWSFITVIQSPSTPVLATPANGAAGLVLPVTLKWYRAEREEKYRLQVATDSLFLTTLINDSTITDTVKSLSNLNYLNTYYWRIKASNTGGESQWSNARNFRTLGLPSGVSLYNPANLSVNQPVNGLIFRWSKSFDQTEAVNKYQLQITSDSLFTQIFLSDSTLTDTVRTVNGLTMNKSYFWRVRAKNEHGWSNWSLRFSFSTLAFYTAEVTYSSGWNMLSVPLKLTNMAPLVVFPSANSLAYGFSNGYYTADSLKNKSGYWLRFPAAGNVNITGSKINDSIQVLAGWNMIGVNDLSSPVSGITTIPSGIINSLFYGFSNGYQSATTLEKGKGYWVRVNQNGIIKLNQVLGKTEGPEEQSAVEIPGNWGRLTITDAAGNRGILYTAESIADRDQYVLPPVPPAGIFDVRYEGDSRAEELTPGKSTGIRISSGVYPLKIKSEGFTGRIKDGITGAIVNRTIMNGEEIVINTPGVEIFTIEGTEEQPLKYELMQNYPNPFNPSTTIGYSIAERNIVSLKIYNQTGEKVDVLVSEMQEAGRYNLVWNADKYSSGIYFCELKSGDFRSIRKLILLK